MTLTAWISLGVMAACFGLLLLPALRSHDGWRAMITPLASIIGSGFLVVGPVLASVAGHWATAAMAGLCAMAWLFGAVIRFNIVHAEPLGDDGAQQPSGRRPMQGLDKVAQLALVLAYLISVAYYLNLLGAFALKGVGITDALWGRVLTSAVVIVLGVIGFLRGFKGIEHVEVWAVTFKLAVILGVLVALAMVTASHGYGKLPEASDGTPWHALRVLLGSVILVQGFETSRFLGDSYDRKTRIASMRWGQLLASAIYVVFIFLVLPFVPQGSVGASSETEIIDVVRKVVTVLGPALVLAAVASQLSAAVADMGGAGGLLTEATNNKLSAGWAYAGITLGTLALTWTTDIFQIIAIASRAFAVYYLLQCALAFFLARGKPLRQAFFVATGLMALAVVVLGVSAG